MGGVRGNYCSAEAASLEGDGRRDKDRGEVVIPQRQNGLAGEVDEEEVGIGAFIA